MFLYHKEHLECFLSRRRDTKAQRTHGECILRRVVRSAANDATAAGRLLCGGRHVRATGARHESKPRKYKMRVLLTSFLYLRGLLSCSAGRDAASARAVRLCLRVENFIAVM